MRRNGICSAGNERGTVDIPAERTVNAYGIKTNEDIDREMTEAFSEVFGNEFDKNNFPGMIITYDESGVPIVTDPDEHRKVPFTQAEI